MFLGIMLPNIIWFAVPAPDDILRGESVTEIVDIIANNVVVLMLTIPPCAAFLLFALDRKNYIAAVPACGFTVCHPIYGIVNFIV